MPLEFKELLAFGQVSNHLMVMHVACMWLVSYLTHLTFSYYFSRQTTSENGYYSSNITISLPSAHNKIKSQWWYIVSKHMFYCTVRKINQIVFDRYFFINCYFITEPTSKSTFLLSLD